MSKGMTRYARSTVVMALVAVSLAALATPAGAQSEAYLELLRADVQANKVAIMTEAMMLTDEQGVIFWPMYREYQADLSKIDDEHFGLIKEYAAKFDTLTDDEVNKIAKTWFTLEEDHLSLLKKTHKKVSKEVNPGVASRFVQVENVLLRIISLQISSQMPLFPDSKPGQ